MKKYIAVIGYNYRIFKEWVSENRSQEFEYIFIDRPEKAYGRVFEKVEYMYDCDKLFDLGQIQFICKLRLREWTN